MDVMGGFAWFGIGEAGPGLTSDGHAGARMHYITFMAKRASRVMFPE